MQLQSERERQQSVKQVADLDESKPLSIESVPSPATHVQEPWMDSIGASGSCSISPELSMASAWLDSITSPWKKSASNRVLVSRRPRMGGADA